jgi:hypothetical protein
MSVAQQPAPTATDAAEGGSQYRSKQTWSRGQSVPAQTIAGLAVAVDEVLE